jgi:hypothetical protein
MATSFTEYRGFGFWSWDPYLGCVAGAVADSIMSVDERKSWLTELAERWKLQAKVVFSGCISLELNQFVTDEERKNELQGFIRHVISKEGVDSPIHRTGVFLLKLLDGEISWTVASPLDYMVEADPAYLNR